MVTQSFNNAQTLINSVLTDRINKRFNPKPKGTGLLDFVSSPYGRDIASGLLAQSGYTTMPSTFGQTVGQTVANANKMAMQRNMNELSELGTLANLSKNFQTPKRNTAKGADGFLYYTDTGERVLPNVEAPTKERKTATDVNGVLRYVDDGTVVFEGVEKKEEEKERKTATDSFGVLRFVDNGEQVFSGDKPKEKTFATAKDVNDQLRYTEGPNKGDLVFPKVVKDEKDEERKTAKDIDGILRYVDNGEKVFSSDEAPEDKRETAEDIDGVLRYVDNGEQVFPTDKVTKTYNTAKDVNGELRYTEGPNIGERVFDVEKKEDEKERKTQTDINGVLRYLDNGEPVFPDVTKAEDKRETKQDVNNQWRYVDDGTLVFPNVTKVDDKTDEDTFKRYQGFKQIAKDKFNIILNDNEAKLIDQSIGENVTYINDEGKVVNRFEELLASYFPERFNQNQSVEETTSPTLGSTQIQKQALDEKVLDLSETMQAQNYTETLAVLNEVKRLTQDGIAGFGATGSLPDFMLTPKGKSTRSAFARLFNTTLKDRSGVAVTLPELERLKQEFNTGTFKTDKDLKNALNRFERILSIQIQSTLAGYPAEVIEQYKANGGLPQFNLGDKYGLNDG